MKHFDKSQLVTAVLSVVLAVFVLRWDLIDDSVIWKKSVLAALVYGGCFGLMGALVTTMSNFKTKFFSGTQI